MKCFYHSSDLDGHCSGAIVKHACPECEMHPINYEDEFPWNEIEQGERVFMVDFTLQPFEQMIALNKRASLIWIDHHKTAIEESQKHDLSLILSGYRDRSYAACVLTWEYLFPNNDMPEEIRFLGLYDVWDHENPDVYSFQMGMRLRETDPVTATIQQWWSLIFDNSGWHKEFLQQVISEGEIIITYQNQTNAKLSLSCAFEIELDGLKFIAANVQGVDSKFFNAVWNDERHDAMLPFGWKKGQWTASMFTTPEKISQGVDVGQIARIHGGGGHAGAAGFQCQTLPFALK